jgi:hypothetical protein
MYSSFVSDGVRRHTGEHLDSTTARLSEGFEVRKPSASDQMECVIARGEEALAPLAERRLPWPEQVRAVLGALIELTDAEPEAAQVFFAATRDADAATRAHARGCLAKAADSLRAGRDLTPRGAELPASLEAMMVDGVLFVLARRARGDGAESAVSASQLTDELTGLLLEPYGVGVDGRVAEIGASR